MMTKLLITGMLLIVLFIIAPAPAYGQEHDGPEITFWDYLRPYWEGFWTELTDPYYRWFAGGADG